VSEEYRFDYDKVDEVAVGLLLLGMHTNAGQLRAWKGMAWEIMERMHEKGWIGDPRSKAKSVLLTEEGEGLAREFACKHFGLPD